MRYNPDTRTITLEPADCHACRYGAGPGLQAGRKACDQCNGTGNGPRGGKGKCRPCFGRGRVPDFDNPVPCDYCQGDYQGIETEGRTDTMPAEVWQAALADLTITVVSADRRGTWNEAYLGSHCLFSVTDYGRLMDRMMKAANAATANGEPVRDRVVDVALDEVLDKVIEDHVQAIKVATLRDFEPTTMDLADGLVILIHRDGYKVVAHRAGIEVY